MIVQIWHNPRCSKSRQTLELLKEKQIDAQVFLYLEEKPNAKLIGETLEKLGISARELLRKSEDAYKEQNLKDKALTEQQLISAMVKEPKLIERPIVIRDNQARLGRPPEQVLEIL